PVAGKREADERVRMESAQGAPMGQGTPVNDAKGGGLGRITGSFIDAGLCWGDLGWLRRCWRGKLVVKGIMGAEDARLAVESGVVDGIVVSEKISNHGGRNLDTSPPPLLVLLDIHQNYPLAFARLTVLVDGGVRRGTDILKCLCLGATAVGLGRPFLYALNCNGEQGVEALIELLKDELSVAMALVGITDLRQCRRGLVNTRDLDRLVPRRGDDDDEDEVGRRRRRRRSMRAKL
ncbi:MAG: hypothetical protein Q9197_006919, partial [Variospora fuerteventurae]